MLTVRRLREVPVLVTNPKLEELMRYEKERERWAIEDKLKRLKQKEAKEKQKEVLKERAKAVREKKVMQQKRQREEAIAAETGKDDADGGNGED